MTDPMTVTLPDGAGIPRLGLGTRAIGGRETAGVRLFDTAQAMPSG